MYYRVQISFCGEWQTLSQRFSKRDDAEWQIARWRQENGSNGKETGFRVIMETADLAAMRTLPGQDIEVHRPT